MMYFMSTLLSIIVRADEAPKYLPAIQHLSPFHGAARTQVSTVGISLPDGNARSLGFYQAFYTDKSGARVPNYYRILGFTSFIPNSGYEPFRALLQAGEGSPLLFRESLDTVRQTAEFKKLIKTTSGSQMLLKQISGLINYLEFKEIRTETFINKQIRQQIEAVTVPFDVGIDGRQGLIRYINSAIDVLLKHYTPEHKAGANAVYKDALKTLGSVKSRVRYNFKYGLTSAIVPDKLSLKARANPLNLFKVGVGRSVLMDIVDPLGTGEK